ncbi:MAG: hypothetical protein IJV51_06735 [Oscillospiraceae bacterium]|nr:hypothetical protein [Oscillospiraceae bacterium]
MIGIKVFSLLFGTFAGLICWAVLRFIAPGDAWMAVPAGIGCAIVLHAVIQSMLYFEEKRYQKAEAAFPEPALFSCDAVNHADQNPKGARFYIFRDRIALLQMGNKPYQILTKPLSELKSFRMQQSPPELTLCFADGQWKLFLITGHEDVQHALQKALDQQDA